MICFYQIYLKAGRSLSGFEHSLKLLSFLESKLHGTIFSYNATLICPNWIQVYTYYEYISRIIETVEATRRHLVYKPMRVQWPSRRDSCPYNWLINLFLFSSFLPPSVQREVKGLSEFLLYVHVCLTANLCDSVHGKHSFDLGTILQLGFYHF